MKTMNENTITREGKERLEKLIEFIDKLPSRKFDFFNWVTKFSEKNHCGTVCCAFGWSPAVFPDTWEWRKDRDGDYYIDLKSEPKMQEGGHVPEWGTIREDFFEIHKRTFDNVFESSWCGGTLGHHATKGQWLANAHEILSKLEVIETQ